MKKRRFRQKKKKKFSLKIIFFGGLFFCLLGGLVYFLIWSPFLWIEKIEVESLVSDVSDDLRSEIIEIVQRNLAEKFWRIIPQKSIVLVPDNKVGEDILARFPEIRMAAVYRQIPNIFALKQASGTELRVVIEERESIGVWCQVQQTDLESTSTTTIPRLSSDEDNSQTDVFSEESSSAQNEASDELERQIEKCFYIDKEGIIYRESPLVSGSLVLSIYSAKNQSADIRAKVVSPELIDYMLNIKEKLPKIKTASGLSLKAVDFEIISIEDLRVTIFEDWQIYFNPTHSVDSHLKALQIVLDEQIKEKHSSLEYIDLRIEGRVYYK